MTAPTVDPLELIDDLDSAGDGLAHYGCWGAGDDDPQHSICGAPIRGLQAPANLPICGPCQDLKLLNEGVLICAAHGGLA